MQCIVLFRAPKSLQGCDGRGEGRGILYIKASLVHWKEYTSGSLSSGLKKTICFWKFRGVFSVYFVGRISSLFRASRSSVGCSVAQ
jgi:hypothetical protein